MASNSKFPIDILGQYQKLEIDPWAQEKLTAAQKVILKANIQLCRDVIMFFTSVGSASGYGGHTGGAFDTVPEVMLLESFFLARPDKFIPICFDAAGHRVATQYLLAVLHGDLPVEALLYYRVGHKKLPGHPELGYTPGVKFSSGRLGHMWAYVNGVAMANPGKTVFCLSSDGSMQEGNDAEAARLCVAQGLNVKILVDDNDVTIAGHPSEYLHGYSVANTCKGQGLEVYQVDQAEDIDLLYAAIRSAVVDVDGPVAVVNKRLMAPGVKDLEGTTHGHDAAAPKYSIPYLKSRGLTKAVEYVKGVKKSSDPWGKYLGSGKKDANRKLFGTLVSDILDKMPIDERIRRVRVFDCDLMGSTGLNKIFERNPEVFVKGGIMERGNLSAAAGFGMAADKQGIFSTFCAFLEMCCSEITMARLNESNLLCHFSHSGCDDMADNTCHFGLNLFFADNGLVEGSNTSLFFPADAGQLTACVNKIFWNHGLRFVFTTRSKVPQILTESGQLMYGKGYEFQEGKDEFVRKGTRGYIVSFGDALYRSLDAVERLRGEGIDVGLVNKCTINIVDEVMMKKLGHAPFVLVVESISIKQGLGIRFGTWLLQRGYAPKYAQIGTGRAGSGGLWEHAYHQGFDAKSIYQKAKAMAQATSPASKL